jgi:hypothetical protein
VNNTKISSSLWFTTLASGSSGNSSLIGDSEGNHFLVDCGISCKRIVESLSDFSIDTESVKGIFITHEHADHINGLMMLMKKYKIPVFASLGTLSELTKCKGFDNSYKKLMYKIEANRPFCFNDFKVNCFNIPHDAAEPMGFNFEKYDTKVSVCTDFGMITDEIEDGLKGSQGLVIEANHDERMLEAGRYPFRLKRRILGDRGHISNENSGKLITKLWNEDMKHVFLGHLSDENNMPELALETVRCELLMKHKNYENFTKIEVANRDKTSEKVILEASVITDGKTA